MSDDPAQPRPPMNTRRVVLGLAGLVIGFVLLIAGLNTLSQPPVPEPTPGTRPPATSAPPASR